MAASVVYLKRGQAEAYVVSHQLQVAVAEELLWDRHSGSVIECLHSCHVQLDRLQVVQVRVLGFPEGLEDLMFESLVLIGLRRVPQDW